MPVIVKDQTQDIYELADAMSNFVVGAEGNISQRDSDGFFIKASGASIKGLDLWDLVKCNLEGIQLTNFEKKPSMEASFHALIYSLYPRIHFIAHTHPTNTLKILCSDYAEDFSVRRLFPDHVVYNGLKSCLVDYSMPGLELKDKINDSIVGFAARESCLPSLILLKNHGIICVGKSSKECIFATQICEKAAEIYLGAKQLGYTHFLTEEQCRQIKNDPNEVYRLR